MVKTKLPGVTTDQAVALMVNMDYIPEGFTVSEMVEAFADEAEADLENARQEGRPPEEMRILQHRRDSCISRYNLCVSLIDHLNDEATFPEQSPLDISRDESGISRIALDSLVDWAADRFGVEISVAGKAENAPEKKRIKWEDVTIKIRRGDKIAWSHKKGKWPEKTFADIGLINRKTSSSNHRAAILIRLSRGEQFPPATSTRANSKDKTAISRLRESLKALTKISTDPFQAYNPHDGWKPRFKLVDARRAADQRAEREAIHVPYDDDRRYEDENDPAGNYLRDHDQ